MRIYPQRSRFGPSHTIITTATTCSVK
jgi:hypothetical protein